MQVKRSKDLVSGVKLRPISLEVWERDPKMVRISVPNRFSTGRGTSSIELTKKEARRVASAILEMSKLME